MLNTALNPAAANPLAARFDEDGFLVDHLVWTEETSRQIAEQEGVGDLTERHWQVINHVRGKFLQLGALPNMRSVCRAVAIPKAEIHNLFGGCLTIWRVAGLPNPGEEAKAYLV